MNLIYINIIFKYNEQFDYGVNFQAEF